MQTSVSYICEEVTNLWKVLQRNYVTYFLPDELVDYMKEHFH